MRTRRFYDTSLIYIFSQNKQHLLSKSLIASIPNSTKATWKNYPNEKFFGFEQRNILDEGLEHFELYKKYKHIKTVLKAVQNIYITLYNVITPFKLAFYKLQENRKIIIDLTSRYTPIFGLNAVLSIFQISRSSYQTMLLKEKIKCCASYFEICTRRFGKQLLKNQVELIQKALTCNEYTHWPICSIAYYFQRKNILHISIQTWYKYARLLGIKRKRIKKIKKPPLPCQKPNEYWHLDLTHFVTKDGTKHFIYFLIDNFSRKILAYKLDFDISWTNVKACIEDALTLVLNSNFIFENNTNIQLITDGGPENKSIGLQKFITSSLPQIKHLIALKDITFSNSMVEATHKNCKYYYAIPSQTENTMQLKNHLEFMFNDFNDIRPHAALKGFTPNEVYFNSQPNFDFVELRRTDAINRSKLNKANACNKCELLK